MEAPVVLPWTLMKIGGKLPGPRDGNASCVGFCSQVEWYQCDVVSFQLVVQHRDVWNFHGH